MSINKSYIESVELSTGTELVIQANGSGPRVSFSIDSSETNISVWLTKEEAKQFASEINKSLVPIVMCDIKVAVFNKSGS